MASRNGDGSYNDERRSSSTRKAGTTRKSNNEVRRNSENNRYRKEFDDEDEYDTPSRKHTAKKRPDAGNKPTTGKKATGKKMSKKTRAKKKRKRIILFTLEVVVLVVLVIVFWAVTKVEKVGKVDLNEENIEVNSEVETNEQMKGYRTIALFGVDSTTGQLTKNTRSDTTILANINQDTKEIQLVSVYRDTYLNVGDDSYNKSNAAYAKGGPEQAINMLNQNLDLQITDFVTIGFEGLTDIINDLGGVSIDVESAEISHLNNYQKTIAEDLKTTYTPVTSTGVQVLNGLQATAYCRIRYTAGDDFRRTERQRTVLEEIMNDAQDASLATLTKTANDLFDNEVIYTSLDLNEILELLADVSSYTIIGDDGFPQSDMRTTGNIGSKGSCVVPETLSSNVVWLHEYLFGEEDYEPSDTVKEYSQKVESDTSSYVN